MTDAGGLLDDLRGRGFDVRPDGDTLAVTPSYELTPADVAAVRAHKAALLGLLRLEEEQRGWPAGEAAALAWWLAYNASVAARPEEAAARREARKGKGTEADEEDMFQ